VVVASEPSKSVEEVRERLGLRVFRRKTVLPLHVVELIANLRQLVLQSQVVIVCHVIFNDLNDLRVLVTLEALQ
jgi:hypothetical protein